MHNGDFLLPLFGILLLGFGLGVWFSATVFGVGKLISRKYENWKWNRRYSRKKFKRTSKYNTITFTGRLKQFFRRKKYKPGQVVKWGKEEIKLIKFIKYNNVYTECWQFQFVKYPELVETEFLFDESDFK